MYLTYQELKRMVVEDKLVEDLPESELNSPVGTGFDFRVGELHKITGSSYLGREGRLTPESEILATFRGDPGHYVIKPREYCLIKTIEIVNLPNDVMLTFYPRSSFFRSGVSVHTGLADPGFSGQLTFGIVNLSNHDFTLEMGAKVAHAMFQRISGGAPYRGKWQGGKMT